MLTINHDPKQEGICNYYGQWHRSTLHGCQPTSASLVAVRSVLPSTDRWEPAARHPWTVAAVPAVAGYGEIRVRSMEPAAPHVPLLLMPTLSLLLCQLRDQLFIPTLRLPLSVCSDACAQCASCVRCYASTRGNIWSLPMVRSRDYRTTVVKQAVKLAMLRSHDCLTI
jgi:hypothetical protein